MTPIRVLLADDHPLVRAGIRASLVLHRHVEIVGEASDGEEAVRLAVVLRPDVVLLDLSMPGLGGLSAAKVIRKRLPSARVIVLTMHEGSEYVRQAVLSGAKGYVLKDSAPGVLLKAIDAVHHGRTYFSPAASVSLVTEIVRASGRMKDSVADLTAREREVLVLVAEGLPNKDIARRLGIGVRTVETHRERVMNKLDIRTAAGLTKYAIANGYIKLR